MWLKDTPVHKIVVHMGKGVLRRLTPLQKCNVLAFQHQTFSYPKRSIRRGATNTPQIRMRGKYFDLYRKVDWYCS